jgi:hypothetical protein
MQLGKITLQLVNNSALRGLRHIMPCQMQLYAIDNVHHNVCNTFSGPAAFDFGDRNRCVVSNILHGFSFHYLNTTAGF